MASLAANYESLSYYEDIKFLQIIDQCIRFWKTHNKYPNLSRHSIVKTSDGIKLDKDDQVYSTDITKLEDFYENLKPFCDEEKYDGSECIPGALRHYAAKNLPLEKLRNIFFSGMKTEPTKLKINKILEHKRFVESLFNSENLIASGGLGNVYKIVIKGEKFAVKLTQTLEEAEFETLQAVNGQPYFIKCFAHGEGLGILKQSYFIYMFEYVGQTLTSIIYDLSAKQQKYVFQQLLAGINHLHSIGIVHGDIKSSNVLVDDEDNIFFIDFGLSHKLNASDFPVGPTYPSPELNRLVGYRGTERPVISEDVCIRSDIFALWIIVDQMVKRFSSIAIDAWNGENSSARRDDGYIQRVTTYRKTVKASQQEIERTDSEVLEFWKNGLLQ